MTPCSGKRAMPMLARTDSGLAIDDQRTLELLQHLPRGRHGAVEIGRGQHQRELVAAEPRHRVHVAQRAAEP